jgi:anaerobic ribonucleoside-triphosphate reductase activating protein
MAALCSTSEHCESEIREKLSRAGLESCDIERIIDHLVDDNFGVNCFLFLGEGRDPERLLELAAHVRALGLAPALYSGRREVDGTFWEYFDYVKVGPYIPENGPLNNPGTNQRLYRVLGPEEPAPEGTEFRLRASGRRFIDITSRFWHRGLEPLRA